MRYLLDVNALVALGLMHHESHDRVAVWVKEEGFPLLATCSITELGFVRVVSQVPAYGVQVAQARRWLLQLKKVQVPEFSFISDGQDISHLPSWVKSSRQTTDGHLVELARANGAVLATLEKRIPGAYLIA